MNDYQTRVRLQKLVGPQIYNQIRSNFQVVSTLQSDDEIVALTGCMRNSCDSTQSLLIYDVPNDTLKAWYHWGKKVLSAQEDGVLNEEKFNVDVQDMAEHMDAQ